MIQRWVARMVVMLIGARRTLTQRTLPPRRLVNTQPDRLRNLERSMIRIPSPVELDRAIHRAKPVRLVRNPEKIDPAMLTRGRDLAPILIWGEWTPLSPPPCGILPHPRSDSAPANITPTPVLIPRVTMRRRPLTCPSALKANLDISRSLRPPDMTIANRAIATLRLRNERQGSSPRLRRTTPNTRKTMRDGTCRPTSPTSTGVRAMHLWSEP